MLVDLPESPRYLLAHGRITEAHDILARLTSATAKPDDPIVKAQAREILTAVKAEQEIGGDFKWKELWEGGEMQNGRRIALCFGIQLMQQVCGVSVRN
jgi:hypothetical protein